jgi:AraC-like DNA-binding protein
MNNIKLLIFLLNFLLFLSSDLYSSYIDTCISFLSPSSLSIIKTKNCTLSLKSCEKLSYVNFIAHYYLPQENKDTSLLLGTITSPPYILLWNTEKIPNQLYKGMSFTIQAVTKNGLQKTVKQDGVFIANKKPDIDTVKIPFEKNHKTLLFENNFYIENNTINASIYSYWNLEGIVFKIIFFSPHIINIVSKSNKSSLEAEILIDPLNSKLPYPDNNIFSIILPLKDSAYASNFKINFSQDGLLEVLKEKQKINFKYHTETEDVNKCSFFCLIPKTLLNIAIKDSFGCNIILRFTDENNNTKSISWINCPEKETYSPFLWPVIVKSPKPLWTSLWILWLGGFFAGFILSLIFGIIYSLFKKRTLTFEKFEQTEEEKKLLDDIYQIINEYITRKDLNLEIVSKKMGINAKKIESIIKKNKQKNFKDFIMSLRIEIVKERLRSSHASEINIAESCGFKNISEMEKYFKKFCHTTPYNYRKENQVV